MKKNRLALAVLAGAVSLAGFAAAPAVAAPQGPPPGYDHDHDHGDWDAPPAEFREAERRGFHDGVEGARKDFDNHRRPDVNNRDEYRHPRVERDLRHDYREGFRRGYERAMSHLSGEGPR